MADPNLEPPSPKSSCKPEGYITGYPLLPSPTPTTELRLGSSQQKESLPITQDQMVNTGPNGWHSTKSHLSLQKHTRSNKQTLPCLHTLWTAHWGFHSNATQMIQAPQDLAGKPPCLQRSPLPSTYACS